MKQFRRLGVLAVLLILGLSLSACGDGEQTGNGEEEVYTLTAYSAFAENNIHNDGLWRLQEKVEEKSDGRLKIVWGGGPEAIPTFQLVESVKSGMADIAWTGHTFCVSHVPVAEGGKLTQLNGPEERESGAFAFWEKVYKDKLNAVYIGRGTPGLPYHLYMNVPIQKVEDFKGLTIRVTPAYQAFVTALGAETVTTDPGEVYNALERGVVQGYGWPAIGITDFGWEEVTKYVIDPGFYQVDCITLVSGNAWERLPADLQEILKESMAEVEDESEALVENWIKEDRSIIQERGVEVITLSTQEAEKYLNIAYEAAWEQVIKNDPELGPQLRELISK